MTMSFEHVKLCCMWETTTWRFLNKVDASTIRYSLNNGVIEVDTYMDREYIQFITPKCSTITALVFKCTALHNVATKVSLASTVVYNSNWLFYWGSTNRCMLTFRVMQSGCISSNSTYQIPLYNATCLKRGGVINSYLYKYKK